MSIQALAVAVASVACSSGVEPGAVTALNARASLIDGSTVIPIDLSPNASGGGGRTISTGGLILGSSGSVRGWWQAPSAAFTTIDPGYVQGGNRNADAGAGQGKVLLSTNGGAPWSDVALAVPAGISAGAVIAHDVNDHRTIVGNTLGASVYAVRWDTVTSAPIQLPLPTLQYPAYQVTARSVNNSGTIVGYVLENVSKRAQRYEALVWIGTSVSILPAPSGNVSQLASNINDAGVISGFTTVNGVTMPIRWTPSGGGYVVSTVNFNPGGHNLDTGINSCGIIVGGSDNGAWAWDGVSPPVILRSVAGAGFGADASDINDAGQVVGSSVVGSSKGSQVIHATLWTGLPSC